MAGRNWTDFEPAAGARLRRIWMDEIFWATDERLRVMRANSLGHFTSEDDVIFYFSYPGTDKSWGTLYPQPPFPDCRIRPHVIGNMRRHLGPGYLVSHYSSFTFGALVFCQQFMRDNGNDVYTAGGKYWELHQDAFGANEFTDLTSASVITFKNDYVDEVRACLESLCTMFCNCTIERRERRGSYSGAAKGSLSLVWDEVKSDWNGNSWGSWGAYNHFNTWRFWEARVEADLEDGELTTWEYRITVDLDREITGEATWPPTYRPAEEKGEWHNIFPPLGCRSVMYAVQTNHTGTLPIVGNTTSGGSVQLTSGSSKVTIDSDLIAYCGAGHGAETFVFSGRGGWDGTDLEDAEPPTTGTDYYGQLAHYYGGQYGVAPVTIVFEPNWMFGRVAP